MGRTQGLRTSAGPTVSPRSSRASSGASAPSSIPVSTSARCARRQRPRDARAGGGRGVRGPSAQPRPAAGAAAPEQLDRRRVGQWRSSSTRTRGLVSASRSSSARTARWLRAGSRASSSSVRPTMRSPSRAMFLLPGEHRLKYVPARVLGQLVPICVTRSTPFEGLGALLWAGRARAELEATGMTPRKRDRRRPCVPHL